MTISSISRTSSAGALLLCLAGALAAPAAPAEVAEARKVMEKTVEKVVAILQDEERTTREKRVLLEEIAQDRFDFRTMSRLVLRREWRALEPPRRDEFVEEFTTYLANDYGRRLERYEDESVEVVGADPKGTRGDVVVETVIRGGDNDGAVVGYRLRRKDGDWLIINVVVEGISLVHNFADQFREVISRQGAEGLLEQLREKNAAAKEA